MKNLDIGAVVLFAGLVCINLVLILFVIDSYDVWIESKSKTIGICVLLGFSGFAVLAISYDMISNKQYLK